ncbi:MAG: hypothetical protein KKF67_00570, partial [Nanoarchaeota archaeon]|nr:hypothetical protein [Nanoarchaeota archaeon]
MKKVENTKNWMKLFFFLYLFVLSIELIKKSSLALAPNIQNFLLEGLTPLKAICAGWFTTSIVQSSGATGTITAAFAGNTLITLSTAIYIIIGAFLGT